MANDFFEIGRVKISKTKELVISRKGNGNYSIAQVIVSYDDDNKRLDTFLKNAIEVEQENIAGVCELIDKVFASI